MDSRSLESVDQTLQALQGQGYVADRSLATAVFLASRLNKPLLLEGEAGVGKTELAKVLATVLGARLIRLQGYEGIDVAHAVYEWNYARQIMAIRLAEAAHVPVDDVYSPHFLTKRPLLQALEGRSGEPRIVLLLDEVDRVDDEFEAYLLEILSDFQVTVPELGTISAAVPPVVVMTSNRTRELHDALKRRCLYHWIELPTFEKELAIVASRLPATSDSLRKQVVTLVHGLRGLDLYKKPGIAETLDWTRALSALLCRKVDVQVVEETLGVVLKNQEDVARVSRSVSADLVAHALE